MKTTNSYSKVIEFDPSNRLAPRIPTGSMYRQRPLRYFAVALLLCVPGINVHAETLCVATPAQLRAAVQSAEDSAAATEIRVR